MGQSNSQIDTEDTTSNLVENKKTFTEIDRSSRCGKSYLIPLTPGYLQDSGKCDAGRYCSAFNECSGFQSTLINQNNAYDGPELLLISTDTNIAPPESNYKIVYDDSFPAYFGNNPIYKKM